MRINFKHCVWVLAVGAGLGIAGSQAAGASPQDHDRDHKAEQQQARRPDYSKNKTYILGFREGRDDHARNRDHFKTRQFKRDEDRQAYEAGYQNGHDRK
jgi:ribosome modulation factor